MRSQWSLLLLAFAGACSFQASCGGKKLDMDKAKTFVTSALETETGQKPETTCPSSVKIAKGATFECTARFSPSAEAKVVIEQNDDEGNVTVKAITGILISKRLEAQIAEGVGKEANVHVEVSCGDRVRAAKAGDTFQCDVKDAAGQTAKVNVSVKDAAGNVSWEVVKS
jgi:hypothetical protein